MEKYAKPILTTTLLMPGDELPMTDPDDIRERLERQVDLIIDGGQCSGGRESTIVDVTGETPVVLREGAISRQQLERVCRVLCLEGG